MRRLVLYTIGLLAVGLLLVPAALAANSHLNGPTAGRPDAPRYGRFGSDPTYNISGIVLDFAGNPVAGAEVDWGYWTSTSNYVVGGSNTDTDVNGTPANGSFAFTRVTGGHQVSTTPSDDLHVYLPPTQRGLEEMEADQLDFATTASYTLQPAEVDVDVANAPGSTMEMVAGSAAGYAHAVVPLTTGQGAASVMPINGSFDDVVAYPYVGSGLAICQALVEWLGTPITLSLATSTAPP